MNLQNKYRKQGLVGIVRLMLITFSMVVLPSWVNKPFTLVVLGQPKNSGNEPSRVVVQKQRGDSGRTFADWCREKASLSPEIKYTVEVLLEEAGTTNCEVADRQLSSLTELKLDKNQIRDIEPLASLTNLNRLVINKNEISDIKPLASLTNLNRLDLSNNQISNIKPLESLTKLNTLQLENNQISDIKPLASLTKLNTLELDNNQISDIKPLASLINLVALKLSGNPITPKVCPLKLELESACEWEP
jgi:hypothetical protein